jgi:hypothetical protein
MDSSWDLGSLGFRCWGRRGRCTEYSRNEKERDRSDGEGSSFSGRNDGDEMWVKLSIFLIF